MFIISHMEEDVVRTILYKCFPISESVCEIGVAEGSNAKTILTNAKPKILHLIDPWIFVPDPSYRDPNNTSNEEGERRYMGVLEIFKDEIKDKQVIVHRDFSYNIYNQFPNNFFDWILIDSMHTYEGVRKELNLYHNKIKDNGFIMLHDYTNHAMAKRMNFGVVEAIDDFCKESDFEICIISIDNFGSCILTKKNNPWANQLVKNMLGHFRFIIQVKDIKFNQILYIENDKACVVTTIT